MGGLGLGSASLLRLPLVPSARRALAPPVPCQAGIPAMRNPSRNHSRSAAREQPGAPTVMLPTATPGPASPYGSSRKSPERFVADSPLEGTGFEPSVARQEKWSM